MRNDWFRSWHGAPTDNKWLLIAKRAGVKPIHVSGTWWALLDHASQHPERGTVDDFDAETFALFAGLEEDHVSRIVTELCAKGMIVDGRIAQWGKRQPKKEDPTAGERKRRQRGKNGGNPPNNGGDKPHVPDSESECHAASHNVTTHKDKIREDSSVANATGTKVVPHPAADFAKAVFDSGVALLTGSGRTERDARSIIGRWRKTNSDPAMLDVLRRAEIEQPSDPVEWIVKALEASNGRARQSDPSTGLRGRRPDPALDLYRAAVAAEEAERSSGGGEDHFGTWAALPAVERG